MSKQREHWGSKLGFIMKRSLVKDEFLKGTTMNRFMNVWQFLIRWLVPIAVFIIILEKSNIININNIVQQLIRQNS